MRIRVLPYRQGSKSAKALSEELGGKVLRLEGSSFKKKDEDLVINWGSTAPYPYQHVNYFGRVKEVSNKKTFFSNMGLLCPSSIPRFFLNSSDIPEDAYPIVCRTVLAGHSGEGIVIANNPSELVAAQLYVQYKKKKDEYRVHLGEKAGSTVVISLQRKARRSSADHVNWQIRNHSNGFVYIRDGVSPPACVIDSAKEVFTHSGLGFGAVDVIYNEKEGKAYVLEINTAPGLEGQTVLDYANFFKDFS